ncbi:hypothetical protein J007_04121 [Cryptococcus neoformans]|nr:hypothetical protein J007_04121 [Cryptococcus neoformans var. grubii]OXC60312.1 hypothetical protein C358_04235 [Cryptococcus neoformans var. grubii MW-RSA852]
MQDGPQSRKKMKSAHIGFSTTVRDYAEIPGAVVLFYLLGLVVLRYPIVRQKGLREWKTKDEIVNRSSALVVVGRLTHSPRR